MITIGIDPHKRTHTAVAVSGVGELLDELTIPTTAATANFSNGPTDLRKSRSCASHWRTVAASAVAWSAPCWTPARTSCGCRRS